MKENIRILCVDDEVNVLKALNRLFMETDYEVFNAGSGQEGLAVMEKEYPVQVIISDYRMPGMNGVDFLRQVYKRWPDTVRIVLSGYADTASIVSAINEGQIYKFIPKPWNDDELMVTIEKAVETYLLKIRNDELTRGLRDSNEELKLLNERLEDLVAERTNELIFQNKVLVRSQKILDSLPAGVIGLDTGGMIAQCNAMAISYFGGESSMGVGKMAQEVLPPDLLDFIAGGQEAEPRKGIINLDKGEFNVWSQAIHDPEGQEGTVLLIVERQ